MVERRRQAGPDKTVKAPKKSGGNYFPQQGDPLDFIPSGCTLLDCVLTGGLGAWPLGRFANIVGDKSTGKTLLAIEACANFARMYPKGRIWYRESEAAFDATYAQSIGLPLNRVDFGPDGTDSLWNTIEDIFEDLNASLDTVEKDGVPSLYIVDSLDALTSRAALKRDVDKGSYGLEKPKITNMLFQQLVRRIRHTKMCLIIVSQVRTKIGVVFGEKYRRAGGDALDFYASLILWLSHLKTLHREISGIKRTTAIHVKARCKKNKVTAPFRDCDFTIRFGYGVDDLDCCLRWLKEVGLLGEKLGAVDPEKLLKNASKMSDEDYDKFTKKVSGVVKEAWAEVESRFQPKRKKYG